MAGSNQCPCSSCWNSPPSGDNGHGMPSSQNQNQRESQLFLIASQQHYYPQQQQQPMWKTTSNASGRGGRYFFPGQLRRIASIESTGSDLMVLRSAEQVQPVMVLEKH